MSWIGHDARVRWKSYFRPSIVKNSSNRICAVENREGRNKGKRCQARENDRKQSYTYPQEVFISTITSENFVVALVLLNRDHLFYREFSDSGYIFFLVQVVQNGLAPVSNLYLHLEI